MQKLIITSAIALILGGAAAHANPIQIKGSYTVTQSNPTGNEPTITDDLSGNFTENLYFNSPTTPTNFISISPAGTSGRPCGHTMQPACNSTNDIATDTVTVTFSFTLPTGATGNLVETGFYQANYDGQLSCSKSTGNQTDCIDWSLSNDPVVVKFSDGDSLDVTLLNAEDWTIIPKIQFELTDAPSVPEPGSIAIFGTALAGLGLLRRRRK